MMMEGSIPVHVISLSRSGRRDAISKVLADRGVSFRVEEAVDGQTLSEMKLADAYDDEAVRRRYGRSMTCAEVACFMSHRSVWQAIAKTGRAAVVLEDDAILDDRFFAGVLRANESALSAVADIVLLGRSKLARSASMWTYFNEPLRRGGTTLDGLRIGVPFKQWTSGAVGYLISAQAAGRALAFSDGPIGALLDDWPWHRDHCGLRVAELRPYVVWENFEVLPSSIEGERKARTIPRARLHDAALWPLRLLRTAARWAAVAVQRVLSPDDFGKSRHD
jgi:glycosyl transferase family 25